jgi:AraC-like DNA-binding protein
MTPDSISEVIYNIINDISKQRNDSKNDIEDVFNSTNEQIKLIEESKLFNRNMMCDKIIREMVYKGESFDANLVNNLNLWNIEMSSKKLGIMSILPNDYKLLLNQHFSGDRSMFEFAMINIINEILAEFKVGIASFVEPGMCIVLFSFSGSISDSNINTVITNMFNKISKNIYTGLNIKFVYYSECIQQSTEQQKQTIISKINVMEEMLKQGNFDDKYLKQLKVDKNDVNADTVEIIRELYNKYYIYIVVFAEKNNCMLDLRENVELYYHFLKDYGSIGQLNKWINDVLETLKKSMSNLSRLVNSTKNYVYENYNKNISLSDISNILGVSASYLSRTFAKETGSNFIDFLTKVRIEKAIELMQTGEYKIYEISEMTGYTYQQYFSLAFKRYTGKSPKEYMK